ncbi:MAG: hypothetical protein R3C13_02015 [Hyphomonas sp.]|uniref:hypothetical protein n=1 Tax=Hyphomonas sp. TaxID=87 RepID=UPI0035293369
MALSFLSPRVLMVGVIAFLMSACMSAPETDGTDETQAAAEVVLSRQGYHLVAEWTLPLPVTQFTFQPDPMSVPERAAEWSADAGIYAFDGYALSRRDGAAFDHFSLTILPAQKFYDRFYVPVARIGEEGWVVYGWAFAPEGQDVRIRVDGLTDDDIIYAHGDMLDADSEVDPSDSELIYFGPPQNVSQGVAGIVAGNDVPGWLHDRLDAEIKKAAIRFSERYGVPPKESPVLVVTYSPEGEGRSWKGGSLGRFITMHLRGLALDPSSDDILGQLTNLAAHETAHVWLGQMFNATENDAQSWLHEGAAEYAANRVWMSPDQLVASADRALAECRSLLGAASLRDTEKASRGPAPYQCGLLVQLIADAAAHKAGTGDIFDIWATVFEESVPDEEGRPSFDTALFRSVAERFGGEAFGSRLDRLEEGLSEGGWREFAAGLSELGIETEVLGPDDTPPDEPQLAIDVLVATLKDHCTGGYSIYGNPDHYFLDMGDRCAPPLNGGPRVAFVNGKSLVTAPREAYTAVRRSCAAGEPLVFAGPDGAELAPISCGDQLNALQTVISLRSLPAFGPV